MTFARRTALLVTLAGLVAAPMAQAEPARNHTYAASGAFKWDSAGSGFTVFSDGTVPFDQCTSGARGCDDTLIKLESPGVFTAAVTGADTTLADVALDLFESDATGAATTLIAHSDAGTDSTSQAIGETVTGDLPAGFYLVRVDFLAGDGTANLESTFVAGAAEAAPAPAPAPPAPSGPAKPTSKNKTASAGGASGTAAARDGVAKVEVGVLRRSGKKCSGMTKSGSFKKLKGCTPPLLKAVGTDSWAIKFKKKLPSGRYTMLVKVTDKKGKSSVKRTTLRVGAKR